MPIIGFTCWDKAIDTTHATGERHHLLSALYTEAILDAGGTPVILPAAGRDAAAEVLDLLDGLVISGGGDIDPGRYGRDNTDSTDLDPARDEWELVLVAEARRRGMPTLGICRGCQILNVAAGGTLTQHVWGTDDHLHLWNADRTHLATGHHDVELQGMLAEIYGKERRRVNTLHHQAIDDLGDGLEVVGRSPDGVIEAVVTTGRWPALAVQWHPERLDIADERPLFEWIVARAAA